MHGLVNRAVECFLRDTYGRAVWSDIAGSAGIDPEGFEAMLDYPDPVTERLVACAAGRLGKPRETLLEDLGTYLVSREPLRRLLRFGGVDYADFLQSLAELPGRAHLALPELAVPGLDLRATGAGRFRLLLAGGPPGWAAVLAGILRAMADDYGALAVIDIDIDIDICGTGTGGAAAEAAGARREGVTIELLEADFAEGRRFDLARPQQPPGPPPSAAAVAGAPQ